MLIKTIDLETHKITKIFKNTNPTNNLAFNTRGELITLDLKK